jgi:hypothetical protein
MAQKSNKSFDYVAHVQRNGQTVELAGTMEDSTMQGVYQFLLQKATELGGWLLTQHIRESDTVASTAVVPVVRTSLPAEPEATEEEATPTFGASEMFGKYNSSYAGASRLTFKEK